MHEKVLTKKTISLLDVLEKKFARELAKWILAGGTGLALQLGHRRSDDLDYFRTDPYLISNLHDIFKSVGDYETLQEDAKTLTVILSKVKLSFFCVSDPFIFKPISYRFFNIADIRDIALMKLAAISGRGSKKDFIDLYTILRRNGSLRDFLGIIPRKYGKERANIYHILKSLAYFEDAEKEPMPKMLEPFNWKECKNFFIREAHSIILP